MAGAFRYKPDDNSTDPGKQFLCDLIGGLLEPGGGLWLADSPVEPADPPAATGAKPGPLMCELGQPGNYPDCEDATAILASLKLAGPTKVKAGKKAPEKINVQKAKQKKRKRGRKK